MKRAFFLLAWEEADGGAGAGRVVLGVGALGAAGRLRFAMAGAEERGWSRRRRHSNNSKGSRLDSYLPSLYGQHLLRLSLLLVIMRGTARGLSRYSFQELDALTKLPSRLRTAIDAAWEHNPTTNAFTSIVSPTGTYHLTGTSLNAQTDEGTILRCTPRTLTVLQGWYPAQRHSRTQGRILHARPAYDSRFRNAPT